MPTSSIGAIDIILRQILDIRPKTVLDVGIGLGKYGFLIRNYYEDVINNVYKKEDFKCDITGIEIYDGYKNPVWEWAYNRVLIVNAIEYFDKLDSNYKYDLILCCAVIEHFYKDDALKLIKKFIQHGNNIIVETTIGRFEQGSCYNNENEKHLSFFYPEDFRKFGGDIELTNDGSFVWFYPKLYNFWKIKFLENGRKKI